MIFLAEHGGNQLFGRGLAIGAGHTDDFRAQCTAMFAGQLLQGRQAVFHKDIPLVASHQILWLIDNGVCTTLFDGLRSESVAVECVALEGEENRPVGAVAAVGGHLRVLLEDAVKLFRFHVFFFSVGAKVMFFGETSCLI